MSTAYYNQLAMNDVLTESIDSEPQMDATGVDQIATKITFTFQFTLISGQGSTTHGLAAAGTFVKSINAAIELLSAPQKRFRFDHDGQTLVDILPGAVAPGGGLVATRLGTMDVDHGPKPRVTILGIPGNVSCRVRMSVVCVVPVCAGTGSNSNGVLNLRFWIGEDYDLATWCSTRTYQGRLRLAHNGLNPHAFRNLALPPIQPGFHPTRAHFQGSEDGLTLDFSIVFQEQWAQAPAPATDWDGNHHVSSPDGVTAESEVNLWLSAPKNVPQRALIGLASKILRKKLDFDDLQKEGSNFLVSASFSASLKHNRVEASARVMHTDDWSLMNVGVSNFAIPVALPGYNKEVAEQGTFTATVAGLFLAAMQTPCAPAQMPRQQSPPTRVTIEVGTGSGETTATGTFNNYNNTYSESHKKNAYLNYKESNFYKYDEGKIHLPVSGTGSVAGGSILIDLYPAQATRRVKVAATRLNAWPELPLPGDFVDGNGINHKLLSATPTPHAVQLSADGIKTLHTADFEMTLALSRKPKDTEALSAGRIPLRAAGSNESNKSQLVGVYVPYSPNGGIV